jgi:hypothetical protein
MFVHTFAKCDPLEKNTFRSNHEELENDMGLVEKL